MTDASLSEIAPPSRRPVKPSPEDVLLALDTIQPGARVLALDRDNRPEALTYRRPAMAAARALGWSYPKIGRAFRRDHTTVMQAVETYQRRVALGVAEAEMRVFRALIPASHRVVADRLAGVVRMADYRTRRAGCVPCEHRRLG